MRVFHSNISLKGVPTFLVVSDAGVKGMYDFLEEAKQILSGITNDRKTNRLIAEVDINKKLNKDPHIISGKQQLPANGFNKHWQNWDSINALMVICQKYLDSTGNTRTLMFMFFIYTKEI